MRRTSRLVLLIGIFLAAVVFIVIALNGIGGPGTGPAASAAPTTADTVIALVDIPLGTVVTQEMVTKQVLSLTGRDADALGDPSQAIGQTARRSLSAGGQVHTSDFKVSTTQLEVPTGKRAFAISVNQLTGVGNLVQVGDNVDVLITLGSAAFPVVQVLRDGTITVVTGLNSTSVKLPLLLENVQILGTIDAPVAAPANGAAPAASGPPTLSDVSKILILAVTPEQSEVLLFARTTGTLDVVLRSPLDADKTATGGVILKTLIDKYGVLPPQVVQTVVPTPHP